jgi:hypothetical protein
MVLVQWRAVAPRPEGVCVCVRHAGAHPRDRGRPPVRHGASAGRLAGTTTGTGSNQATKGRGLGVPVLTDGLDGGSTPGAGRGWCRLNAASWKKGRRSVGGVRDANGSVDRRGVGAAVSRSPPWRGHDAPVPGQRRRREAGKVRLLKSRQRRGGQRLGRGVHSSTSWRARGGVENEDSAASVVEVANYRCVEAG